MNISSKLFNQQGYIPLKEYIDDINTFKCSKTWRLPFVFVDYIHFSLLSFFSKISLFSSVLYIEHISPVSPGYLVLLNYLKRKNIFDTLKEVNLHTKGYHYFSLGKKVNVGNKIEEISGHGISTSEPEALSIAIGEILERAIAGIFDLNTKIIVASAEELEKKHPVYYPPNYHRFLDEQKVKFKELNYAKTDKIMWIKGCDLVSGEEVYLPKQITSWFNENRYNLKKVFVHPTTNGSAGYFTKDGAIVRGVLEIVQRDAFLTHWLTMTVPEIIDQETLPEDLVKRVNLFKTLGLEIYLLNITALGIPSVIMVAINNQAEVPQVVVSAASNLTFYGALSGAMKEMVMMIEIFYHSANYLFDSNVNVRKTELPLDMGGHDRVLYWRGGEMVQKFKWFLTGKKISYNDLCERDIVTNGSDKSALFEVLEVLKKLGKDYYPVVYYPKNEIQGKLGFHVVQVYIPKAFPFYLQERYATFDSDRLHEFAASKNRKNWILNREPHMFS